MQTIVEDDKRGRVMAFYTLSILGVVPFGSLLAGFLADHLGVPATLVAGGILCLTGALWFTGKLSSLRSAIGERNIETRPPLTTAQPMPPASAVQVSPES